MLALKANVADVYTKAVCDDKYEVKNDGDTRTFNNAYININSGNVDSYIENKANNGALSIGGNNNYVRLMNGGNYNGALIIGGDNTDAGFFDSSSGCGVLSIGGNTNTVYTNANNQTMLIVGGIEVYESLKNEHDSLFIVGNGKKGLHVLWDNAQQQTTMKINGDGIYTKKEVDVLIAGGGGVLDDIKAKVVYITAPDELYYYTLSCEDNTLRLITSESDLIATFNNNSLTYFANTDKPFSIIRETSGYDTIASTNNALRISSNDVAITGNESTGRVVLAAKDIVFNGTLNNVYTKQEVDELIAGGGGGGGTYKYLGPDNQMDEFAYDGTKMWSLGF